MAMTYSCPKGHVSEDPDFCSDCGAKIAGAPVQRAGAVTPVCPDCGAERSAPDAVFCEVCGFNYSTGAHGEIALPPAAPEPAVQAPIAPLATTIWSLHIEIEAAARDAGSPAPPADVSSFEVTVTKPVNLIGRRSAARAIDPEIALDFDDAVSHRHAILTRGDDGSLTLRDIGSSNGTEINGALLPPMTDHVLRDGDRLTLGHWTCITMKSA